MGSRCYYNFKKERLAYGPASLFCGGRQPAARIIRPPLAGEFHTCGLRSVFSDAHVVRKNDWNLFRVCERESLRRFAPCAARGACFLPVRAENAAGGGWEMLRRFGCGGLFAARGSKGGTGDFACLSPEATNAARECLFAVEEGKGGRRRLLLYFSVRWACSILR